MDAEDVRDKAGLVAYIATLRDEMRQHPDLVYAATPDDFLESAGGWLEDAPTEPLSWSVVAKLLWAGVYYE
jgi:hypothetical protein